MRPAKPATGGATEPGIIKPIVAVCRVPGRSSSQAMRCMRRNVVLLRINLYGYYDR